MQPAQTTFNIVVLGAMNPSIHSAGWYKLVEVLDADEFEQAVSDQNTICVPPFARVQTRDLVITCQEARWEVQTNRFDNTDRLGKIAASVFDDILKETPVRAFGFNFIYSYKLDHNAGGAISKGLENTGLEVDWNKAAASEFAVTTSYDDHNERVTVQSMKDPKTVSVATNFHYPITREARDEPGYFSLRDRISEKYAGNQSRSLEIAQEYIERISKK